MAFTTGLAAVAAKKGINQLGNAITNDYTAQGLSPEQTNQAFGNTQSGLDQQQAFINAVNAQNGLGNQASVFAQQQGLANQLQGIGNGTGPNPALSQLNETTGQNVANQAALMAGQRGAGANVGLIARQAAQQGGALQQQAVGQGATLQAQQQLAALSALQQQQASMAGVAGTQVGQQQNALSAYNQAAGNQLGSAVGSQGNQNSVNAAIGNQNTQNRAGLVGGVLNSAGQGAAMMAAHGGVVPEGNCASPVTSHLTGMACGGDVAMKEGGKVPGHAQQHGDSLKNDTVPAMLSPGEVVIPRSVLESKDPGEAAKAFVMAHLGKHGAAKKAYADGGEVAKTEEPGLMDKFMAFRKNGLDAAGAKAHEMYGAQPPVEVEAIGPDLASNTLVPGSLPQATPAPMHGGLMAEAPQQQAQNPFVASSDAYMKNLQGGINQQQAGISGEARTQTQLGKQNEATLNQDLEKRQQTQQKYQLALDELQKHTETFQQDIANSRIDPNRFLGKMDTTGKVMTGIGLLLSGIGSGLTHQDNMAMKYLQTQIDHDIDAQKAELGKKENLLSANLKQYGNLNDAVGVTRAMMNDTTAKQIEKNIAGTSGAIAQARGQQAIGQLQAANAGILSQIAMKKALFSGGTQGGAAANPAMLIRALPENEQAAAFKELKEAEEFKVKRDTAIAAFDKVAEAVTPAYKLAHPLRALSGAQAAQMNAPIAETSKDTTGKYNEAEAGTIKQQFKPTGFDTAEDKALKRRGFINFYNQKGHFPILEGLGLSPQGRSIYDKQGNKRIQEGKPKI